MNKSANATTSKLNAQKSDVCPRCGRGPVGSPIEQSGSSAQWYECDFCGHRWTAKGQR
jgi:formate dehydrogenase maturation protein FdhE